MLSPAQHHLDSIWGHDHIKALLRRMLEQNRLPHALLLHGPDGVGKRSLAFAMAKMIFSTGLRVPVARINAPRGARFLWHVEEPSRSDDDLFGGMDDMFGAEPEPQPEVKQEPIVEPEKPKAPRAAKPKIEPELEPKAEEQPRIVALDPRVDKLVAKCYPVQYDGDTPIMTGFVDLNIIEPIKSGKSIKVEQTRSLQDIGWTAPMEGRYRVILVFGADTITPTAANSLLKLLEEPPSHLVIILVTDHYYKVLETIRSRCASLLCHPLDKDELTSRLVQEERYDPALARVAASLAEGRVGMALEILSGKLLEKRRAIFESRLMIDRRGVVALPYAVSQALGTAGSIGDASLMLLSMARDRLVRQLVPNAEHLLVNSDLSAMLDETPRPPEVLHEEAERLLECLKMQDHPAVPAPEAPLELALWPA